MAERDVVFRMREHVAYLVQIAVEGRCARLCFDVVRYRFVQLALHGFHLLGDRRPVLDDAFHALLREPQQPHARTQIGLVLRELGRFLVGRDDAAER